MTPLRACHCGREFHANRAKKYCSPECRPKRLSRDKVDRDHYSDISARHQEIKVSTILSAARRACRVLGPPEPLSVKLDRLRLAGIENRRMEGKSGCPRTNRGG